ncbi:hypothetical protein C7S10_09585 [Nocardioides currus]|uniref:DUF4396 domain-containing protein n=2 Tax=Nocardioides currus TaxID=2133958 RepID=A0A2R7YZW4_9ACTN|nr:hypothetical protein C7S10_09585 [Nocardioides currus]
MAASATLHCLTGCAIGEILGLLVGTAAGLTNAVTIALSIGLAFVFGYALSTLPLVQGGVALGSALKVVLAADTLSILTMEVVDNAVVAVVPGAMDAGLVNPVFWLSMMLALAVAFVAAFPVNRALIDRGQGHALTHDMHGDHDSHSRGPTISAGALAAAIVAFLVGGLTVSVADELAQRGEPATTRSQGAMPMPGTWLQARSWAAEIAGQRVPPGRGSTREA